MNDLVIHVVGWTSTLVLIATLASQIVIQWKTREVSSVSPWLFAGQCLASIGFLIYSVLSENTVFIVSNSLILATAIVGEFVRRDINRRQHH